MIVVAVEKLSSMPRDDQEKHCVTLVENLGSSERGSAKLIQLLGYCATIGCIGSLADVLVQHNVLTELAHHVKEAQQIEMLVYHHVFGLSIIIFY